MRHRRSPVPRLLARCHLNVAPRSVLRTFIGVDAELGARGPTEPKASRARRRACRCGRRGSRSAPRWEHDDAVVPQSRRREATRRRTCVGCRAHDAAGAGEIGALASCTIDTRRRCAASSPARRRTPKTSTTSSTLRSSPPPRAAARYDGRPRVSSLAHRHRVQLLRRRRSRPRPPRGGAVFAAPGTRPASRRSAPGARRAPDVERALARLSEAKRITLLLAEVEGLTCPEIAELLAIPIGTVWTRLHAARRELRQMLEGGP